MPSGQKAWSRLAVLIHLAAQLRDLRTGGIQLADDVLGQQRVRHRTQWQPQQAPGLPLGA